MTDTSQNLPRKVGRPTKYDPSFVDKVDEYLKTTGREQTHLPKIVSFAKFIGVNKDTLYEWASAKYPEDYEQKELRGQLKHPEFSDALAKIMEAQEEVLIDDGIYGGKEVNSTIVKLLLQNNHGMKERSDVTSDDEKVDSLVVTIVESKTEEIND